MWLLLVCQEQGLRFHAAQTKRACIVDRATGERWLEVPELTLVEGGPVVRPALHICSDKGAVGWPGLQWAVSTIGLRSTLVPNPLRQDWNGLNHAALESGV